MPIGGVLGPGELGGNGGGGGGGGGGSGTVTSVSVVTANGFAGTVANPTTTPAITMSTTITGLLKGNGTAISAAVAGTDYVVSVAAADSSIVVAGAAGVRTVSRAALTGDVTASAGSNATTLVATSNVESIITANTTVAGAMQTSVYDPAAIAQQVVGTTAAQTITSKRITRRSPASTSGPGATPLINTDLNDIVFFTALATAITSMTTGLSGTPNVGDSLIINFTDNGTARGITWGASFESSTMILPSTTVINTLLTVAFLWNSVSSKWRCVGVA